jgi:hypothetical protein
MSETVATGLNGSVDSTPAMGAAIRHTGTASFGRRNDPIVVLSESVAGERSVTLIQVGLT